MRIKGLFVAAFVAASALLLSGCDYSVANAVLHGRWVASGPGGPSLEFSAGRFTRTLPGDVVETGTYSTSGRYVTFHRQGRAPETLWFTLDFPRLTMGAVGSETGRTYFHNSPSMPEDLQGDWMGFRGVGTSWTAIPFLFGAAEPQRGNRWVMEGEYELSIRRRGDYTVRASNIPNAGVLTMRSNYIHGGDLLAFIRFRLHVRIMELFNWEELQPPGYHVGWWLTEDEARRFFVDAAVAAGGDLSLRHLVLLAKDAFFAGVGVTSTADFTLERMADGVNIYDMFGNLVGGDVLLSLRFDDGVILTFARNAGSGAGLPLEEYEYIFGYGPRRLDYLETGAWAPEGILLGSRSTISEVQR